MATNDVLKSSKSKESDNNFFVLFFLQLQTNNICSLEKIMFAPCTKYCHFIFWSDLSQLLGKQKVISYSNIFLTDKQIIHLLVQAQKFSSYVCYPITW